MNSQRYLALLLFLGVLVISTITLNNIAVEQEASTYRSNQLAFSSSTTSKEPSAYTPPTPPPPPPTYGQSDTYSPNQSDNYNPPSTSSNNQADNYTPPYNPSEPPHPTPLPTVNPNMTKLVSYDMTFVPVESFSANLYRYNLMGNNYAETKSLQQFLVSQGYLTLGNDTGYFGPLTEAALTAYQKANNIFPPFGYFGPKTREAVNSYLRSKATNSSNQCECGTAPNTGHWSTVNPNVCKVDDCTGSSN